MNARQEAFAREYAVDHNATQAAIRAGYSSHTAKQQGHDLLTKPDVAELVKTLDEERNQYTVLTREFVINGLMDIARTGKGSSQVRAYELLGKHLALFTDRVEVTQITRSALEAELERLGAELALNSG